MPNKNKKLKVKRKAVSLTFILATDFTKPENKRIKDAATKARLLAGMKKAIDFVGVKTFDVIPIDQPESYQAMRERNIPELWCHDASINNDIYPSANYYLIEFDDKSRKMCLLMMPEDEEPEVNPMYQ